MTLLPLTFAIILSIAHYRGNLIHLKKNKQKVISFGAGVLLAYLILELFPNTFKGISLLNNSIFLFILLGFILFYLTEKFISQQKSKSKKLKELKEIHSLTFLIYYLIIGIILFNITIANQIKGFLFFIPLLFHTTIGSISMNEMYSSIKVNKLLKLVLSSSPIIGVILASSIIITPYLNHILLAFISGAILCIITREVIPKESKVKPLNFLLGISTYTILIIFSWI